MYAILSVLPSYSFIVFTDILLLILYGVISTVNNEWKKFRSKINITDTFKYFYGNIFIKFWCLIINCKMSDIYRDCQKQVGAWDML